jgi:hypothetical protein
MSVGSITSLLWSEEFADHKGGQLPEDTWNFDLGDGSSVGLTGWGNHERGTTQKILSSLMAI